MESRKLQYIGKKASKPDNICKTGLIWEGPGDVKEVPSVVAERLLQHTDIWRDVTDEVQKTGQAPAIDGLIDEVLAPTASVQFRGGRGEQIMQALQVMDETNTEHYDENGKPSIAVIEQILGYEISPDELGLVMQDIQRARDESAGVVNVEG